MVQAGQNFSSGSATSDGVCLSCPQGEFQSLGNHQTSCTRWRTCQVQSSKTCLKSCLGSLDILQAGQRFISGSATSDASCLSCPASQFQSSGNHQTTSCSPWRTCQVVSSMTLFRLHQFASHETQCHVQAHWHVAGWPAICQWQRNLGWLVSQLPCEAISVIAKSPDH